MPATAQNPSGEVVVVRASRRAVGDGAGASGRSAPYSFARGAVAETSSTGERGEAGSDATVAAWDVWSSREVGVTLTVTPPGWAAVTFPLSLLGVDAAPPAPPGPPVPADTPEPPGPPAPGPLPPEGPDGVESGGALFAARWLAVLFTCLLRSVIPTAATATQRAATAARATTLVIQAESTALWTKAASN